MNNDLCSQILNTIKNCLPKNLEKIELHEPYFIGNEIQYVTDCIKTNWVSTRGKYVDLFEEKISEFTSVNFSIATQSGTAALHSCLEILGTETNDEILVPDITFVATVNSIAYCNAIPHFVDCCFETLGVDYLKLDGYLKKITKKSNGECYNKLTNRRIKSLLVMHTFGHPVDLDPILEICKNYKLNLVEDAAEALGTFYKNKHVGSWGRLSILSFNGNKIITTGSGGMILTNDEKLAKLAKHITTTARIAHKWQIKHDMIGYNYRMSNVNAAIGCAQMENMQDYLKRKRKLAEKYENEFKKVDGVKFFQEPSFARSNYWLNVLLLDEKNKSLKNDLLELTNNNKIATRPLWELMHKLPMYRKCPKMDLTNAININERLINIPSSVFLTDE